MLLHLVNKRGVEMNKSKTRLAVGAVIMQSNEVLLVHKVKVMTEGEENDKVKGTWDFPKGGVEESDVNLEEALLGELEEETGSKAYKIIRRYNETIDFKFPKGYKYASQKTIMYHVIYTGDRSDIKAKDEEIDDIKFVEYREVLNSLELEETKSFFVKCTELK